MLALLLRSTSLRQVRLRASQYFRTGPFSSSVDSQDKVDELTKTYKKVKPKTDKSKCISLNRIIFMNSSVSRLSVSIDNLSSSSASGGIGRQTRKLPDVIVGVR